MTENIIATNIFYLIYILRCHIKHIKVRQSPTSFLTMLLSQTISLQELLTEIKDKLLNG